MKISKKPIKPIEPTIESKPEKTYLYSSFFKTVPIENFVELSFESLSELIPLSKEYTYKFIVDEYYDEMTINIVINKIEVKENKDFESKLEKWNKKYQLFLEKKKKYETDITSYEENIKLYNSTFKQREKNKIEKQIKKLQKDLKKYES